MKTILVTGASGFIGGHLARHLADRGYNVIAQYRRQSAPARLAALEGRGVKLIRADLTDAPACEKLLAGVDAVIHSAALAGDWGPWRLFEKSNFRSTVELAVLARRKGVRKFVYISSITVHGFGNHTNTDETGPYFKLQYPYPRSKKMAEEYILAQNSREFATCVIRPGNVYGPDDTTTFYPMFRYIEKGFMGYISGGRALTCPVFIDDLAAGIIAALESEKAAGEVYNLANGDKVTWKELVDFLYAELGVNKKAMNSPAWFSMFLAYILSFIYRLFRVKTAPPLTTYRIRQAANNYSFRIDKARRELGYAPKTTWRDGMKQTVAAFRFGK